MAAIQWKRNRTEPKLPKEPRSRLLRRGKPADGETQIIDSTGSMDLPYLVLTLLLLAIGLLMLFSASFVSAMHSEGNSSYYFVRQAIFAVLGIVLMLVVGRLNYFIFYRFALVILGVAVLLLLLVPFAGIRANGARRWFQLFGITFQPSEIAKLGVVLSFAAMMSVWRERMGKFKYGVLPYAVIMGVMALLLYLEPHMSATLIIIAVGSIMMFLGGTKKRWFLIGLGLLVLFVLIYVSVKGYAGSRISAWQNPEADAQDSGYQIIQSQYAIGSGGFFGLGFGHSRQKYLYLPEEHNDYIFAIVCEELGFAGAICIILLFVLLIIRGYWIAIHARDRFGMLTAAGLTTLLALQVFLNMAVVSNLLPSTGISLPFFSYGGTALVIQLVEMGIVLSISRWGTNKETVGKGSA